MESIEMYKDLPEDIYDKFDKMTDEAYELFINKQYEQSFKKYKECLSIIPDPKKDYGDSSNVIEWMVDNYMKIQDYSNAIIWVENLGEYLKNKNILGDWEFLKGKVYFESGDLEKSLDNFKAAYAKAGRSIFNEQDPKYLDFYKNPKEYIKQ
jgi:tetratricopeptide (TPR) repeat protein